jgi:hypothetical protein
MDGIAREVECGQLWIAMGLFSIVTNPCGFKDDPVGCLQPCIILGWLEETDPTHGGLPLRKAAQAFWIAAQALWIATRQAMLEERKRKTGLV